MTAWTESIQDIQYAGLIVSMMLLVIGLVLWAAGRRVLRPSFAALALIAGAGLGWVAGSNIDLGVPALAVAIIAALLCMCFAAMAFRALVATSMAAIIGVAAPMAVWGGAVIRNGGPPAAAQAMDGDRAASGAPLPEPSPPDEFDAWLAQGTGGSATTDDQTDDDPADVMAEGGRVSDDLRALADTLELDVTFTPEAEAHIERAGSYVRAVSDWGHSVWERTPPVLRPGLVVAAVIGAITGLLVGTLASSFCVSIVTACGGSLLWLASSIAMARELELSQNLYAELTPATWLLAWAVISVIGLAIQWTFRPAKADNTA
jgi:hypothetical protein